GQRQGRRLVAGEEQGHRLVAQLLVGHTAAIVLVARVQEDRQQVAPPGANATGLATHATGLATHATGLATHATGLATHATGLTTRAALADEAVDDRVEAAHRPIETNLAGRRQPARQPEDTGEAGPEAFE